jgi:hypothetical protein
MNITTKSRPYRAVAFLALLVGLSGCSGGSGGGGNNNPPPPPPPPPPAFNPVFSEIQSSVFNPNCATSGCHQGAGAPQGLRLDETNSYALLVDVDSTQDPTVKRVAAGDPNNSYLIQKLEGTASVGQQMPAGGPPLPQANIDIIRQWITDGALDDRAPSGAPIRVTSLSPIPGSVLNAAPTEIVAMFDRELDVSTVNSMTFVLTASGGDGTFTDGNETVVVPTAITTPAVTPMSATMDIAAAMLADDTYRVELFGTGASIILDIDANALDGEYSGTFPSGDGTGGGNFSADFEVATPPSNATLDAIQTNVFTPNCTNAGCHSGGTPAQGMNLEDGNSFANLVNVASAQVPALMRVNPGDPDNSYLIQKLEGTAAVGVQMPAIGGPLNQTVIDDIRLWITNGAQQ